MPIVSGRILTLTDNGELLDISNGAVLHREGKIISIGSLETIRAANPNEAELGGTDRLVLPGFVDCHLHYPQLEVIGSYGEELLGWLNRFTFPTEESFSSTEKAREIAELFSTELLKNGTTCAAIFSTSHLEATRTLFRTLGTRGLRAFVGKVAMDRNCPSSLAVPPSREREETESLVQEFHGFDGRLFYALTPRFAPTSSPELLQTISAIWQKYPELVLQTHFAENRGEIQWVRELFPDCRNYLDVYDKFGLLSKRTLLTHSIHLEDSELDRIAATGAKVVHCPSSNLFLGSGLFPLQKFRRQGISIAIGSDIGGGTSFSLWQTLAAAYGIQKVQGQNLSPVELFRMATLDGARALGLGDKIGSLEVGKFCDLQILNPQENAILRKKLEKPQTAADLLFSLAILGDDRIVETTIVQGAVVYSNGSSQKKTGHLKAA